jgi:hypothetical protein
MSKYFKTKAGSLEDAILGNISPNQSKDETANFAAAEGKLPPALQKAIDKKNGKKTDDEDDVSETNKNDKSDDGEGLDAVQPKAVKKKFADRKDKDIDNDGDTDSSDKFLHKKRKAISKSMKEDVSNIADVITAMWGEAADKMDAKKKQLMIDKKNGEKSDDEDAEENDGKTMTGKPMSKVEVSVKEKD